MTSTAGIDHGQLERDVALAADGDQEALGRATGVIIPALERHIARFRLPSEDHQDVLQNTLIRLQQRIGDFRGDSRFLTWASRVATNEALMFLRSQRRHRRHTTGDDVDLELLAAPEPEASYEGRALAAAVNDLPKLHQSVLHARYANDLSIETIARELRTTQGSVRSTLLRARRTLKSRLREAGFDSLEQTRAS